MIDNISKLEQGKAEFAFECAQNANRESFKKEYKQYSKKLITMIKTNGLGATLAFILSKGDNAYNKLGDDILGWLKESPGLGNTFNDVNNLDSFVSKVISLNSDKYFLVTAEVISFLGWLKRFSEGLIDG
jgi:CRISPR-associated protein Cmr5